MTINTDKLRDLIPLNKMDEETLGRLALKAKYLTLSRRKEIYSRQSDDDFVFYLLDGEISMTDENGKAAFLTSDSEQAKLPFGRLKPRPANAEVHSKRALVVQFNSNELDTTVTWNEMVAQPSPSDSGMESAEGFGVEILDIEDAVPVDTGWLMSLLNSDAFHQIPPENIHLLAGKMSPMRVSKGDTVITQDEQGDYYYVIRKGNCQVLHNDVKINDLGPLGCFGEEALISGNPRNATIVMTEDGVLMRLSKQDFAQLLVPPMIKKIGVSEAIEKARNGAILIDVRTRDEFKNERLGRSINIPLSILRMKFKKLESHNEKSLIVYCDTGARSSAACFLLKQAGFDVYLLDNLHQAFRVMKAKKQSSSTLELEPF